MSELEDWLEKNLPKASDDPDSWRTMKSSKSDVDIFYTGIRSLVIEEYESTFENYLVNGLYESSYGITARLGWLLTEDEYFEILKPIHRKVIAWVLRNPQNLKPQQINSGSKLRNAVERAASLHGLCGHKKDAAIELAAMYWLLDSGEYDYLIEQEGATKYRGIISLESLNSIKDALAGISNFEEQLNSKKTQIYRAIKKPPYKSLFEEKVANYKSRIKAVKREHQG